MSNHSEKDEENEADAEERGPASREDGGASEIGGAPFYGRFETLAEFEPLSDAERRVIDGVRRGQMVRLGRNKPHEPHESIRLRSMLIRYLARGGCEACRPSEKGVNIRGAWIEGVLDLQGLTIEFPLVFAGCHFQGTINFSSARTRELSFNGCRVVAVGAREKRAIYASAARIDGPLNLRNGFHAKGEVRLAGSEISGMLACMGGRFENPGGYAIYAAETKIASNVYLRDGFEARGNVSFFGAEIGRELQCWGGKFIEPEGRALSLRMVKIGDTLRLRPQTKDDPGSTRDLPTVFDGMVDLRGAEIGALEDSEKSWPKPGKLRLDGLVYGRLEGVAPVDAKRRGRWLQLQAPEELTSSFRPQPFEQVMSVLRAMGHSVEARRIGVLKERQWARAGKSPLYLRPVHWLFGVAVGYGYWTSRALLWGLLFVVAGHFIFAAAWRAGAVAPTDAYMLRSPEWRGCGDAAIPSECWTKTSAGRDYEIFSPTLYSIDVFLPIVQFGQEDSWSPSALRGEEIAEGGATLGRLAWIWRTIQEAAGYLLSAFAVAGGARLARREE